jgi:hypothetical protein
VLGLIEPELIVPCKARGTDGKGEVAQPEADVGEEVRLGEGEAV